MAERWLLSRTQVDEFAVESHRRASAAIDDGVFGEEIQPIRATADTVVYTDDAVRKDSSAEKLATLTPAFGFGGVITAGNSSQLGDGAAAVLISTTERARSLGLVSTARIHTVVGVAGDSLTMLTGPIPATAKALDRAGLSIADIGTFEVDEASAPVVVAWLKETGADDKLTNPNGGVIALGHPVSASEARLMTTTVQRMWRDDIRYGLQTTCEGTGSANATIVELV